ncbi:MAG: phage head closure protein [Desulfovibrionaceae bacterium]
MRAGRLRHTVTIEHTVSTQNAYGEMVPAWEAFATRRAAVRPLAGREYFAASGEGAEVTHEIRLRYLDGVTTAMRIVFNTRHFDIQSVINVNERGHELIIMAVETVA